MQAARKLITISIPVYNESGNIDALVARLQAATREIEDQYEFEFLFTDNHSVDDTFERLASHSAAEKRIRVIRFSRNFGFQRSILSNFRAARGEAAIQLDADLQDPPELMTEFLRLWRDGYKVVYGIRRSRPEEARFLTALRKGFYRGLKRLSKDDLPADAGDFRLIDRKVIDQLCLMNDQQPYLRGMIAAMGFRQIGVPYDRSARKEGKSKFRPRQLISLALDGMLHHTSLPLRVAMWVGLSCFVLTLAAIAYYIVLRLFFSGEWPPGIATILIFQLLGLGMNGVFLGIIGEYIGRIYMNVKSMPITITESVIDHQARIDQIEARTEAE